MCEITSVDAQRTQGSPRGRGSDGAGADEVQQLVADLTAGEIGVARRHGSIHRVIAEQVPKAINVLDRFHVMKNMNTAIDEVRRAEVAELKRDGKEQILKHSRWCLLKRPENLTGPQAAKLDELVKYNLKSGIKI